MLRARKRGADVQKPIHLKQRSAQMTVEGIETVNNREAYVVVATPQGDLPERVYSTRERGCCSAR